MSIYSPSCTSSVMLDALLLLWLCGVLLGASLALLSIRLCNHMQRRKQRMCSLKKETMLRQRKQEEETALIWRKQEEEVLDHLMDERIACSACWQERHPGMSFPLPGLRLCGEHYSQLVLRNVFSPGTSQQRSTHTLSSVSTLLAVEEVCA